MNLQGISFLAYLAYRTAISDGKIKVPDEGEIPDEMRAEIIAGIALNFIKDTLLSLPVEELDEQCLKIRESIKEGKTFDFDLLSFRKGTGALINDLLTLDKETMH